MSVPDKAKRSPAKEENLPVLGKRPEENGMLYRITAETLPG